MNRAIRVQRGAVLVVAGVEDGVAVPAMDAVKVDHAAGAEVGATVAEGVAAGVLNVQKAEAVARADHVRGATAEVEAEVAVGIKVGPGAGQGARVGHAVAAEKGAVAEGEAEEGVVLGAGAAAVAVAAVGPAGVTTAVSAREFKISVNFGVSRRTSGS